MIYDLVCAITISMAIMKMLPSTPIIEILRAAQAACLTRRMRRETYNVPLARWKTNMHMSCHGVTVLGFIPSVHVIVWKMLSLGAAVFSLVDRGRGGGRGGDADDCGLDRGLDGLDRHCCWRWLRLRRLCRLRLWRRCNIDRRGVHCSCRCCHCRPWRGHTGGGGNCGDVACAWRRWRRACCRDPWWRLQLTCGAKAWRLRLRHHQTHDAFHPPKHWLHPLHDGFHPCIRRRLRSWWRLQHSRLHWRAAAADATARGRWCSRFWLRWRARVPTSWAQLEVSAFRLFADGHAACPAVCNTVVPSPVLAPVAAGLVVVEQASAVAHVPGGSCLIRPTYLSECGGWRSMTSGRVKEIIEVSSDSIQNKYLRPPRKKARGAAAACAAQKRLRWWCHITHIFFGAAAIAIDITTDTATCCC